MKKRALNILLIIGMVSLVSIAGVSRAVESSGDIPTLSLGTMPNIQAAQGGLNTIVSLDLRSIDITDALKYIALKAGLNIVVSKNVSGKATLVVRDVPLKDVLDIILRSNDLAYAKVGNIFHLMSNSEYKTLYGKSFSDVRKVKTFRIKYAIPEQVFNFIDALKSDIGRVVVDQESGTVVVLDTEQSLEAIQKAVDALEEKGDVKVFDLQYAKARVVEEHLKEQIDLKKLGTVRADERNNQIMVYTLPGKMKEIEKIIQALDRKSKQVFLNALILKITIADTFDTGVDWNIVLGQMAQHFDKIFGTAGGVSLLGQLPIDNIITSAGATQGTITLGRLDSSDHNVAFEFLKTLGETKILSNPRLSVLNNQEARIHVGERQVYVTTTTTTGQTTQTTAEEVTFIDVGIQLAVTPTINDDGYITMKIKPEISSVVGDYTTPTGNVIPIIDSSTAETTVIVKDGATIIIGGLRRDDKVTADDGIPYLMDIPLIGEAFKSRDEEARNTELLILITPTIVEGDHIVTGDNKIDKPSRGFSSEKEYDDFDFQDIPKEATGDFGKIEVEEEQFKTQFAPYKKYEEYQDEGVDFEEFKAYQGLAIEEEIRVDMPFKGYKEYGEIKS